MTPADPACVVEPGSDPVFDPAQPPCQYLSSYRFFRGEPRQLKPNEGVEPFDLITPLFSDYAGKARFLYLPPGSTIAFEDWEAFDFPVGTALIKNFLFPEDRDEPSRARQVLETRLLVRLPDGWAGWPYRWNEEQTDAEYHPVGGKVEMHWTHEDGRALSAQYLLPNINQCAHCHETSPGHVEPLGPRARHLNRSLDYPDGAENQLARWTRLGLLTGAPDSAEIPRDAAWDDPTEDLNDRARGYLEINCAHCHNPEGFARYKQLELAQDVTDPQKLGMCRLQGSQNTNDKDPHPFNIYPGRPEWSRIVARMDSTDPKFMMPRVGRSIIHKEGLALITEWIASMEDDCSQTLER